MVVIVSIGSCRREWKVLPGWVGFEQKPSTCIPTYARDSSAF